MTETPAEAIAGIRVHAPARGNRRLEKLLAAVDADVQVKGWWHAAGVNAARLHMNDHSWVHIQIVLNIALRLARLLFRAGVTPSIVEDHGMKQRDAEVVIAAAALLHCVGMSVHRTDHETYSLFLCADSVEVPLTQVGNRYGISITLMPLAFASRICSSSACSFHNPGLRGSSGA